MSEDTRNIYERIEAARPNFKPVVRNAQGQVGTRHYQYADLDVVCDAVETALLEQGVGVFPSVDLGDVTTTLRILDGDGSDHTFLVCSIPLPTDLTPQQTGSAITYFRRYGLVALLNLRTEPDDDGGAASNPVRTREVAPEAQAEDTTPVVPEGWDNYEQAANAHVKLVSRIQALDPGLRQTITDFRATHGWPLTAADFDECENLVRVAEALGA